MRSYERGGMLIECVLAFPVLVGLVGTVLMFGMYYRERALLTEAARVGSRFVAQQSVNVEYEGAEWAGYNTSVETVIAKLLENSGIVLTPDAGGYQEIELHPYSISAGSGPEVVKFAVMQIKIQRNRLPRIFGSYVTFEPCAQAAGIARIVEETNSDPTDDLPTVPGDSC